MRALLIVDMQTGMFAEARTPTGVDLVVERLNAVADPIRASGGLVVFIQHCSRDDSSYATGQPGWELLPSLDRRPEDVVVEKTICDAFFETELESVLQARNIDELIIGGWATDYCVDTTVRAAVSRRYQVTVLSDGHTAADREHLDSRSIIEHHNRTWSGLLAPCGAVQVQRTDDVIRQIAVVA